MTKKKSLFLANLPRVSVLPLHWQRAGEAHAMCDSRVANPRRLTADKDQVTCKRCRSWIYQ